MSTVNFISGTPGAGKTLYAIEKLLLPLVGTFIEQEVEGVKIKRPRIIYTNIKGLQIEHELIECGPLGRGKEDPNGWVYENRQWTQRGENRKGAHNWHEWAKPGAVIVVDEFQRLWPPRPNGAPVPPDIEAMDTVRHDGVVFILITQNVMNVDRHMHGLCTRHLHVRRVANMHLAIVYEWDQCSRTLMFSKSITRRPWRYDKKVFKLYHSSDLHVKGTRSLPGVLWFVIAAFAGLAFLVPTLQARLSERMGGKPVEASAQKGAPKPVSVAGAGFQAAPTGQAPSRPASSPVLPVAAAAAVAPPVLAGCGEYRGQCRCYDGKGLRFDAPAELCQSRIGDGPAFQLADTFEGYPSAPRLTEAVDVQLIADSRKISKPARH